MPAYCYTNDTDVEENDSNKNDNEYDDLTVKLEESNSDDGQSVQSGQLIIPVMKTAI
ncbi:Hypothetical predicted protein [Paramuricea clavata]|uniref:Uncharacterized protein n=1 Tax=Paramuricea clavata TaxID=317549 RepID=A0A6S7HAL0_PARCT|nr:Hypothetical predicted protein [Paramuricea clavata]